MYIKILESMAKNPEGFQFHTLSRDSPGKSDKKIPKPGDSQSSSRNNSKRNVNFNSNNKKTKEEQQAENDIGSYANLIYGTIKNFFSGIIEIKGKKITKV